MKALHSYFIVFQDGSLKALQAHCFYPLCLH